MCHRVQTRSAARQRKSASNTKPPTLKAARKDARKKAEKAYLSESSLEKCNGLYKCTSEVEEDV